LARHFPGLTLTPSPTTLPCLRADRMVQDGESEGPRRGRTGWGADVPREESIPRLRNCSPREVILVWAGNA
jgi:hypothetical protein